MHGKSLIAFWSRGLSLFSYKLLLNLDFANEKLMLQSNIRYSPNNACSQQKMSLNDLATVSTTAGETLLHGVSSNQSSLFANDSLDQLMEKRRFYDNLVNMVVTNNISGESKLSETISKIVSSSQVISKSEKILLLQKRYPINSFYTWLLLIVNGIRIQTNLFYRNQISLTAEEHVQRCPICIQMSNIHHQASITPNGKIFSTHNRSGLHVNSGKVFIDVKRALFFFLSGRHAKHFEKRTMTAGNLDSIVRAYKLESLVKNQVNCLEGVPVEIHGSFDLSGATKNPQEFPLDFRYSNDHMTYIHSKLVPRVPVIMTDLGIGTEMVPLTGMYELLSQYRTMLSSAPSFDTPVLNYYFLNKKVLRENYTVDFTNYIYA